MKFVLRLRHATHRILLNDIELLHFYDDLAFSKAGEQAPSRAIDVVAERCSRHYFRCICSAMPPDLMISVNQETRRRDGFLQSPGSVGYGLFKLYSYLAHSRLCRCLNRDVSSPARVMRMMMCRHLKLKCRVVLWAKGWRMDAGAVCNNPWLKDRADAATMMTVEPL